MAAAQGRSFLWQRHGRFHVIVHGLEQPTDFDWDTCLVEISTVPGPVRVLVHSEGGAPNAAQRVRLSAAIKGRDVLVSVLTRSAIARAAGIALRWFSPQVRLFVPAEIDSALDCIEASGPERTELVRVLADVKGKLNLSNLRIA